MQKMLFIIKKTLLLSLVIFMISIEVLFAFVGPLLIFTGEHSLRFNLIAHCVCFAIGLASLLATIFHFSLDKLTDFRIRDEL